MNEVGRIVLSKAGRDKGRAYAILQVINEKYVLIADGKYHKLSFPKLKNIRHLQNTDKIISIINYIEIKDLDSKNKMLYNDIYDFIKGYEL